MKQGDSATLPIVTIEIIRGTPPFAQACRLGAASLAMLASANAMAAPTPNATASTALSQAFFSRPSAPQTLATEKLFRLLSDQGKPAEQISAEQAQTLRYGKYPPVKSAVLIKGKLQTHWTLHPFDLVALSRQAALQASRLEGIAIDPVKVGAVMIAESSLVSRVGWSANGKTPSFGLAQLEENTARALGVKDLNDPLESAQAAARLVAEGLRFARANAQVDPRIAMSLNYNTSTLLRRTLIAQHGAGLQVEHLPQATQNHVKNMLYAENRMSAFARLSDQHQKIILAQKEPLQPAQPQEKSPMSTAHAPAPSLKGLIVNLSAIDNDLRLRNNQVALEQAGQLQCVPTTARGLSDMRLSISHQVQLLGQPSNAAAARTMAAQAPSSVAARIGTELATLTQALVQRLTTAAAAMLQRQTAALSPQPRTQLPARQVINAAGTTTVAALAQTLERVHRERELRAEQPRPA